MMNIKKIVIFNCRIKTLILCFLLFGCTESKEDFASRLANDFVYTINNGSIEKDRILISPYKYEHAGTGLAIATNGINFFDIPFIRDGLKEGYDLGGQLLFKKYKSAFGTINDQQIDCNQLLHVIPGSTNQIDYIIAHLEGKIFIGDDSVKINYKFSYDNPSDSTPIDLNSIKLLSGTIQEGEDVYDVKLGVHKTINENTNLSDFNESEKSSGLFDALLGLFSSKSSTNKQITVDSYSQNSSLDLSVGDKLSIEASGTIKLGFFAGATGPDGINGYSSYSKVPEFRHGALLGRIGNGEWFLIGSQKVLDVQTSGKLQLQVNDNDPSNNSGSFVVTCQIN